MSTSRRAFVSGAAAVVLAGCFGSLRAQTRPTIDVKKLGASGNGKQIDLGAVRRALDMAAQQRGATIYFPPGEYFLGAVENDDLLVVKNLANVRFVGDRATISCRSHNGRPGMLVIAGSRNIAIQGLAFRDRGLDRDAVSGAYAVSFVGDERKTGSADVQIADCTFDSVLGAVCTHGDEGRAPPVRGIRLTNLSVKNAVYGFSFSDSGDDVIGRNLTCSDVMRSYFPYGVTNHDMELDTRNNATGFTDVLISCYWKDTTNIRVKLKCRGKRGGDTIINLDHQNVKPGRVLRNINIDADVDEVDCRLTAAIQFRAMDRNRRTERVTDRRWDAISLDGNFRICPRTRLFYFESVNRTPGTLHIGPRLARHPQLPKTFPGFNATVART